MSARAKVEAPEEGRPVGDDLIGRPEPGQDVGGDRVERRVVARGEGVGAGRHLAGGGVDDPRAVLAESRRKELLEDRAPEAHDALRGVEAAVHERLELGGRAGQLVEPLHRLELGGGAPLVRRLGERAGVVREVVADARETELEAGRGGQEAGRVGER